VGGLGAPISVSTSRRSGTFPSWVSRYLPWLFGVRAILYYLVFPAQIDGMGRGKGTRMLKDVLRKWAGAHAHGPMSFIAHRAR
jgi:hypothetical protein